VLAALLPALNFSKHLPQLITKLGPFNIQVCYESLLSDPSEVVTELSLQLGLLVIIQGQRSDRVWLPGSSYGLMKDQSWVVENGQMTTVFYKPSVYTMGAYST
jgi:hypothetical protein